MNSFRPRHIPEKITGELTLSVLISYSCQRKKLPCRFMVYSSEVMWYDPKVVKETKWKSPEMFPLLRTINLSLYSLNDSLNKTCDHSTCSSLCWKCLYNNFTKSYNFLHPSFILSSKTDLFYYRGREKLFLSVYVYNSPPYSLNFFTSFVIPTTTNILHYYQTYCLWSDFISRCKPRTQSWVPRRINN